MKMNVIIVCLLVVFGLLLVGCASEGQGSYQPPSGPIGGGCGIQAPVDGVGVASSIAMSNVAGA